jgi:hypothetical protein
MIVEYILSLLTLVVSKTNSDDWLYFFIDKIGKGLHKFKIKRKANPNYWFKTTYLEKDYTFYSMYLQKKIQNTEKIISESKNLEYINLRLKYLDILNYLKSTKNPETIEWMEELFPQKNKTTCLDSDWLILFSDYRTEDQEEFIIDPQDKPQKIKNYLFFIESIDNIIKSNINPFDKINQQSFILATTFENMLIKICSYSNVVVSKTEIEKIKFKTLAKFI